MQLDTFKKLLSVGVIFLALTACSDESKEAPVAQQKTLTQIDVAQVISKPVQAWFTYTTRLEAPQQVALKPRVSGVIESIEFIEGQDVKEGDLLFTLDNRPFLAQVARLKAQIESAKASLEQATNEADRAANLRKTNAISSEQAESRYTAVKKSRADLDALSAQLAVAKLDLEFAKIRSPINGVISRAEITKGNTVNGNQSVLTSIVSHDKMYAYFDIDERTWNENFSNVTAKQALPVSMQRLGDNNFKYSGVVDFIDNTVNENTGTLRVRAVFNRAEAPLRAGSFARLRIATKDAVERILIPEKAIGTDLKNRFVLTIDENNTLQYKPIELGDKYGEYRAIISGLNAGDIIAVNGPARVGPGMPIKPNKIELDTSNIAFTLKESLAQILLAVNK